MRNIFLAKISAVLVKLMSSYLKSNPHKNLLTQGIMIDILVDNLHFGVILNLKINLR